MTTIQVYDKPMCCSTGVCGPDIDPVLPRFAADLDWLKSRGHRVERFNLSQQPEAFLRHPDVHNLVVTRGTAGLPIVVMGGRVVSVGMYPARDELAGWANASQSSEILTALRQVSSCCGGSGCC